jgi:Flp pilus assembly pilin Flp
MTIVRRLWTDDRGQDLVEYVLLGATIALAGLTAMQAFPGLVSAAYASWDNAQQSLWYPQPPAS